MRANWKEWLAWADLFLHIISPQDGITSAGPFLSNHRRNKGAAVLKWRFWSGVRGCIFSASQGEIIIRWTLEGGLPSHFQGFFLYSHFAQTVVYSTNAVCTNSGSWRTAFWVVSI
ncbi:hypothetical protein B0T21DRAFT_199625 [Apiosordaria backusii]|uniref:Uncharacterized protein n=1 Tax=Apiosordaria backusii TaxID=314023 RepID=A0AA40BEE5_9PEZI|nr:hypothetical protein B0T21DRAFT_199625 [Apiosordaria backusii]